MKKTQLGYLTPRTAVLAIVLLAMLLIPLGWYISKSIRAANKEALDKAAALAKPTATATVTAVVNGNNPNAFGMTWGSFSNAKLPANTAWMSCHGEPKEGFSQAHEGSCNPYKGDSSCRLALPILCIQKDGSAPDAAFTSSGSTAVTGTTATAIVDGWATGNVASTEPVAGFVIGSLANANARCEKELGPGWRMAEFHDGNNGKGGWGFVAKKSVKLDTRLRQWVHINDQPGNCWNNK